METKRKKGKQLFFVQKFVIADTLSRSRSLWLAHLTSPNLITHRRESGNFFSVQKVLNKRKTKRNLLFFAFYVLSIVTFAQKTLKAQNEGFLLATIFWTPYFAYFNAT